MSLFIGNVSKNIDVRAFEKAFRNFGPCKVDFRVVKYLQKKFAFVQFDNPAHAEKAKEQLQNRNFGGLHVNVEWSKNSGRFEQNNKIRRNNFRQRSREKHKRKSPSWQKRESPKFSDGSNCEQLCQRDRIVKKILVERKIMKQKQNEKQIEQ